MKKLLSLLLAIVLSVCLVNLNNNTTKAESSYTVTFDMQGHGTQIDPQIVGSGSKVVKPVDPTEPGYTFDGWYQEAACTTKWNFSTDAVLANTTLYAKWIKSLTFTAEQANSTVTFKWLLGSNVQYITTGATSPNATDWTDYTEGTTITLTNVNDTVSFRGTNVTTKGNDLFSMTGKIAASGDVTSLTNGIGGDATLPQECYETMFNNCTSLTTVPNLPSTSLAKGCYGAMFQGCTGLTSVPSDLLPSTDLKEACYAAMFSGCTNLTNIPDLPAPTLVTNCYLNMFLGCSKIKVSETKTDNYVIPFKLPTSTANTPVSDMFKNTGGTFKGTPSLNTQYYIATKGSQKAEECTGTSCSISAEKGTENIVAHIDVTNLTPANVITVLLFDDEPKKLIKGVDYDLYTGSLTFILNKSFIDTLGVGSHSIKISYVISDYGYVYSLNITITDNSPSTVSSNKDESCEKVIGPTWHWNNTKGVCEEYALVRTYTR